MSNAPHAPSPEPEEYGHLIHYYDQADDEPEDPPASSAPVATLRNGVMNGQASGLLPPRQASLHGDTSPHDPPAGEQQTRQITHTLVKHLR